MLAASTSFYACNNAAITETESVEAAEDSNESVDNDVKEDDSDFMIAAANGGMMEVEVVSCRRLMLLQRMLIVLVTSM